MAYKITLMIDNKENEFIRNGEPTLKDLTNALKVQQQQLRMYTKEAGPSDQDFDLNEGYLAKFAVDFWRGGFTKDQAIDGATHEAMVAINDAIGDSLEIGKDDPAERVTESAGEDSTAKKSQPQTLETPSTNSTNSTKQD